MKTHRIICTTAAAAIALAAFLSHEGYDTTWHLSYGSLTPTVLTLATSEAVEQARAVVGVHS